MLHPGTLIVLWLCSVLMVNQLSSLPLLWIAVVTCVALCLRGGKGFFRLLWRLRFVWLSLAAIFAFAGEGIYAIPAWGRWSPTVEGLQAAGRQILKLTVTLGMLSVLLASLHREKLLCGLLFVLQPLSWVGVPIERFAVRLTLTLDYARTLPKRTLREWLQSLNSIGDDQPGESAIEIPRYRVSYVDGVALAAALGLFLLVTR